ncbi:ABC transporter permease [Actinomyces sp. MRS3W]|uniref:ABC transporter permease n=1 Tax=Actinomyces sp. MRS3W TaxID=2800796 RepID=UPI0028FD52AD|nr:ABC transporter permease [Actinomyces sp. MRS3W]MDU0349078.1 ABC transporter permease [Actinomyces sp. MRS3W]
MPAAGPRLSFVASVRLELAKMRRLRTMPVVVVLVLTALLFAAPLSESSRAGLTDASTHPWEVLLLQYAIINALFSPILVAVLASRHTDIEHEGSGWYLAAGAGLTPGRLCRAKLAALALVEVPALLVQTAALLALTGLLGATVPLPWGAWAGYTVLLIGVALAFTALHILLAAAVDNQIVCVGIGLLGAFIAMYMFLAPQWVARILPWGYWAMICPVVQTGRTLGAIDTIVPPLDWIAGFGALVTVGFALATARLDRIER